MSKLDDITQKAFIEIVEYCNRTKQPCEDYPLHTEQKTKKLIKELFLELIGHVPEDIENYSDKLRGIYQARKDIRESVERL